MSDMPPKKKRPRVAGQPRPGAERTRGAGSGAGRPVAGASSRRAPIQRLGSSGDSAGKVAKSAPTKVALTKGSGAKGAGKGSGKSSALTGTGEGRSGGVAKTAPSRSRAGEATSSRAPLILGALGVLGLIVGLIGFLHPGGATGQDKAFVDKTATSEVLGQIESASCTILGPGRGQTIDQWIDKSRRVLIGPARADWEKQMPQNRTVIEQTQQTNECRVDAIGVRGLTGGGDGAKAQVLANLALSMDQGAMAAGSIIVGMQYDVVRQGGIWKIERVAAW